ncbi:MAG: tetratricopeptide repeat protein [Cyanobacteriota bacterium]
MVGFNTAPGPASGYAYRADSRRSGGLRARLRRWLFPPASPEPGPVASAPWPVAPSPGAGQQDQLAQAERCYAYAEELNNQGAADLAVAFYRQAYVQIRPLLGLSGAPIGQQLALPAQVSAPRVPVAPQPVATTPLQARLEQLRRALNADTAAQVQQELMALQAQGQRDADLFNLLGLAALLRDQLADAEQWFAQTLQLEPNHLRALVNLGGIQLKLGRADQAIEVLGRAVRLAPPQTTEGLTALTNLTMAHEAVGRTLDAAQLALRIFRIKPDHLRPASLQALADTLEQMGEEGGAIEVLRYLSASSTNPDLKRRLAQLLERRGEFQQAALVYRELLGQPQPAAGDRP